MRSDALVGSQVLGASEDIAAELDRRPPAEILQRLRASERALAAANPR